MRSTLLIAILCSGLSAMAQTFKFDHFGQDEGIATRFVYTIDQDEHGFLLVGTDEGLYKFDGFDFSPFYTEDGLSHNFIRCSEKDAQGQMWFGHESGRVTRFDGSKFEAVPVPAEISSRINDIMVDDHGVVWIATQTDGVLRIDKELNVEQFTEGIEEFMLYSIHASENGNLMLGTDMGLLVGNVKGKSIDYEFTDIVETRVSSLESAGTDQLVVGTDDDGIYQVRISSQSIRKIDVPDFDEATWSINHLKYSADGSLWVSTNSSGLYQLVWNGLQVSKVVDYNIGHQLGSKSINVTHIDREGNLWIGSNGNGLAKLVDDYFSFYEFENRRQNEVMSIHCDNGEMLLGHSGGITITGNTPEEGHVRYALADGLADTLYTSVTRDAQGIIWAGSKGDGLYYKMPDEEKFRRFPLPDDRLSNNINQVLVTGSMIWAATDFGIYQIKDFEIRSHMTMQAGLPHNVVKALYRDSRERIWVATHSREITFIDDIIQTSMAPIDDNLVDVECFAEDHNGDIWVGTNGTGVFKITGTDTTIISKADGLYSDYCYSLMCDLKNNIWVGHRGALTRIDVKEHGTEIFKPGATDKLDMMPNSVACDEDGMLWFGTSKGLLRYNLEKDVVNHIEPALNLTMVDVGDSLFFGQKEIHLPYGTYKMKFDFVGISFKKPEDVTYKYFLEGHDLDWSESKSQNFAVYNRLDPGEYTFKVTSYNADGYGGNVVQSINISVDRPFWEKWWFFLAVAFSLFMLVRMIIQRREATMKANQEYLQRELNARTREVVEQKELLEVKNKDITDSIVYAKNIQKAMMPAPGSLDMLFREAFVFFKPRDIVSGDFYWVKDYGSSIILACADCTGHGVPGAFMSLIGNVLLKEVSNQESVQSPDMALQRLDAEVRNTLNKKGSEFGVQDGMDISIIQFDRKTNKLRCSSARRPIIVYKDGQRIEIKGDRFSVGGTQESLIKRFTLHELELSEGDVVYQFSDGITDQFGGTNGKKLKMRRLINMLDELWHLDMQHQGRLLKQKFHDWKGKLPQVDDVIMVGFRI
ncbi:MAG: SpoIIE family protein phosphatase [Flavobacteriales bacterium]|nr:SpoIIE family protein phosphatase [Flavobacteriales bacterium]